MDMWMDGCKLVEFKGATFGPLLASNFLCCIAESMQMQLSRLTAYFAFSRTVRRSAASPFTTAI
jgi:hypothetical protein